MHLHGSRVVSGSRDATLRMWDVETGECLHVLVRIGGGSRRREARVTWLGTMSL